MAKKVGVLTSGGDAPGMNAAIRAVVRAGIRNGCEMYFVYEGYKGLIEGNIHKVDRSGVSEIISHGGTILKSARLPGFKDIEVRKQALAQLKKHKIDALVCIGGDGTYMGAKKLTEMGVNCIGVPGTIDNDIASTDYTIGFDTCLNTIIECTDKIRDTTESHSRCSIIEVMGRHCGDLALFSGIAEGVDMIITPDHPISDNEIIANLKQWKKEGKQHVMIIISENIYPDTKVLNEKIQKETGYESRVEVLGRIQRGGSPSAQDRILAARLGAHAIDLIMEGKGGLCVGLINNKVVHYDIYEALQLPRDKHMNLLRLIDLLK